MVWFILFVSIVWAFTYLCLRGEDLSYLDSHVIPLPQGKPSEEHFTVVESLGEMTSAGGKSRGKQRIMRIREYMDSMSDGKDFQSEITPFSQGGIKGEWVLSPGVDSRRRLLYIHGGAWMAGSPKSHRAITDKLSKVANAAVFSLDYRLLPENRRIEGIDDCKNAYQWIISNGPDGPQELDFLAVAGDSAGGNLTLAVLAWARDEGLRAADAAIAFSPATDATMSSPSLLTNAHSDPMLGPAFSGLLKIPLPLIWWASLFTNRTMPTAAVVSPLRGDLSGLPPVLVQASEAEMLYDDACRYVTKAQAAGSPVELQSWPFMVHVWQIFTPQLPEAEEAFENIAEFLATVEGQSQEKQLA